MGRLCQHGHGRSYYMTYYGPNPEAGPRMVKCRCTKKYIVVGLKNPDWPQSCASSGKTPNLRCWD